MLSGDDHEHKGLTTMVFFSKHSGSAVWKKIDCKLENGKKKTKPPFALCDFISPPAGGLMTILATAKESTVSQPVGDLNGDSPYQIQTAA